MAAPMDSSVSVVVTCHNLEPYVGEAIDSVLGQSYAGPIEIVVVDDASDDDSVRIIRSRPQVRCLRTPRHAGVLMATVMGLRETTGELVFFLDGDDLWRPDKLQRMVARFTSDPDLCLLTHDLEYMDGAGNALARPSRPERAMRGTERDDDAKIRDGILLHSDHVWLGSAYAIRRSRCDLPGFCNWAERLPDPLNTYQDWPLAYWVMSRPGAKAGYLPAKLFRYRLHGSNYSGDARDVGKALRNMCRACNTLHAIEQIATDSRLPLAAMRATVRKRRYYDRLLDLYEGRRMRIRGGYFASLPYLFASAENPLKEMLRFVGVRLFGLRRFVAFCNALRRLGNQAGWV